MGIDASTIADIRRRLDAIAEKPQMYIGGTDPELLKRYLWGFHYAVTVLADLEGIDTLLTRRGAVEACGYRFWARGPDWEMKERGMSDMEIISELIRIESTYYALLDENLN